MPNFVIPCAVEESLIFFYGLSSRAAKTARDLIFGLGTHKLVSVIHHLVRGPSRSLGMTEIISRRSLQNRARFFPPEWKMRWRHLFETRTRSMSRHRD